MMNLMMRLWKDEEGQGMVEYGLIIALIAIVVIVAFPALSSALKGIFNDVATELNDAGE